MYATANMAFRKSLLESIGGFDESFPENLREDSELALRILEMGELIPFFSEWTVTHPYVKRSVLNTIYKSKQRQNQIVKAELRLFRLHPKTYQTIRHHCDANNTLKGWRNGFFLTRLRDLIFRFLRSVNEEGIFRETRSLPILFLDSLADLALTAVDQFWIWKFAQAVNAGSQKPTLLLIWNGSGVAAYQSYFDNLSQYFQLTVLGPPKYRHGSIEFHWNLQKQAKSNNNSCAAQTAKLFDAPQNQNTESSKPQAELNTTTNSLRMHSIPWWTIKNGFTFLPTLPYWLWKNRPNWIYLWEEMDRPSTVTQVIMARCLSPRSKRVNFNLQNITNPRYHKKWHKFSEHYNTVHIHRAVAASPEAFNRLRNIGFTGPIGQISLWADPNIFKPVDSETKNALRDKLFGSHDGKILFFAGSLQPEKGLEYLAKVLPKLPHLRLAFAGQGPMEQRLLAIGNQVKYLGSLQNQDLAEAYQASDYVILFSQNTPSWREQVGRTLLEGILCGCLALGTRSGSIPEIIHFEKLLCNPDDCDSLSELLSELPFSNTLESKWKSEQLRFVNEKHTPKVIAETTRDFLS
jgi:glycosyltransferase involved in cell wall biosynthesis